MTKNGRHRDDVEVGIKVAVVTKQDQRTGELTHGIVQRVLTNSKQHPHGIKVMLDNGDVGRVQEII